MTEKESVDRRSAELFKAIGGAQAEIPPMPMDGYNPYYSSRYTTLGKILEITKPIFERNGIVVTQTATGGSGEVGVETIISHPESGQYIMSKILLPVGNEKNLAQEAGKAITYLRRYALSALFNIYSDEDIDANSGAQQKKKEQEPEVIEPDVELLIKNYWKPLAAIADEMKVEFEPLPPDVTYPHFEKLYKELQEKVERAK